MIDLLRAIDGRIPNFAGIKYTHEDFMDYLSCLQYGNGKYDMIWGRDETFLSALAIGAKAAIGSTFNYAAPLYHQMIQLFKEGKLDEAAVVQERSIDMIRLLGKYGGIATGKAYMKYIGFDCGEFRLPVRNMDATAFERFCSDADGLSMKPYWSAI
jgi:N-acetylneuraminate lyase